MKKLNIDKYILMNYKTKTNAQMALECGCNKSTISNHRKKLGISATELNKELREKTNYICSQHGKKTKTTLAKELNCSSSFIKKIWEENNLTNIKNTVYSYKNNYFQKIDSHQKAYFLGLIASDGNLYRRDGHQGLISLSLNEKDKEIIEVLKNELETTKPISIIKDKKRNTVMATLQITSDEIFNDLLNIGIGLRKTFDMDMNTILLNIPKEFINSFFLGYFDGDGSIDIPNNGISKSHIRISGPISTLKIFNSFLQEIHINSFILEDKRKYKEPFGSLEFKNTTEKYVFLKYIYNSNIKCLNRKRERSKELIKRIENNITNRSENIKAVKNYSLWF